ncbi:MAG: Fpg/Nei family DNA glycosylase [Cytophagaceae bacterium]
MPELPDLIFYKRLFDKTALNKKIKHVEVKAKGILKGISGENLNALLKGKAFQSSAVYGKHLFTELEKKTGLDMHFGMTGKLILIGKDEELPKSARVIFEFDNDEKLVFVDQRKIGYISTAEDLPALIAEKKLGPDARDVSKEEFIKLLKDKRASVKSVLMDQSLIAGIGNVYADEILFQAKIHPLKSIRELGDEELALIWDKMKHVIDTALKYQASRKKLPQGFVIPFRKKGATCPNGNGKIELIKVGGRSTYFCPVCQKQ